MDDDLNGPYHSPYQQLGYFLTIPSVSAHCSYRWPGAGVAETLRFLPSRNPNTRTSNFQDANSTDAATAKPRTTGSMWYT
jgi:hypothetical protein